MFGVVGMEDFSSDLCKTITKEGEGQEKNKEQTELCYRIKTVRLM